MCPLEGLQEKMIHDYKDWIQNKAEELALEEYDAVFYELNETKQAKIYNKAMEAYTDYYADSIDAAYERIRDSVLQEVK